MSNEQLAEVPAIELRNVTIELAQVTILKDVNLKVGRGDVIVLIGPSGAGKTVLLKTMAGLFHPTVGQVFCDGADLSEMSRALKHDLARRVGVQFQLNAIFDARSVYENIEFVLNEHTSMNQAERHERIMECLTAVGLEKYRDFHEYEISGGMRRRLAIARAIALKPELLFLDDPTAGQDPVNADILAELILKLRNEIKATLVVITPDIMRAYQFAGRIVFVADQGIVETGNAEQTEKHPDPRVQQFIHGYLRGPLTDGRDT